MQSQERVYKGKLKKISYLYSNPIDYFERTGYVLKFEGGEIFIETNKTLFLTAGDKIHFTAFNKEDKWFIEEIINVIKPPMQKVTFKQRQANRLMEANY
jgi:hypothetical protein